MSNVFISRKGGGGAVSGAFGVISVRYPAGNTCTLSKGGKVYRDPLTSGVAIFGVPEAGDWTVMITDGEETQTRTISITERGQVELCAMSYSDDLFSPGSGTEALWQTSGEASATSAKIELNGTYSGSTGLQAWAYLKDTISMAGKSALTVDLNYTVESERPSVYFPAYIYIIPEDASATDSAAAAITTSVTAGDHSGENALTIDISGLNQSKRYCVTLYTRGDVWTDGSEYYQTTTKLTVTGAVIT